VSSSRAQPGVLISASAVGYYGDRGEETLTETSTSGDGFLARLCRQWESAAQPAEVLGLRVVRLRTGVVLGRAGGALAQMLPPFQLGMGGPVGSGTQYLPWIHLHDLVKIIAVALVDDRYRGPVNGVAPEQATSRTFAHALGRALHRPAMLPVEPGRRFADLQEKGPYRFWWHEHTFHADGPRTVMEDRVYYTPPLGLFGRLANRVFIRSTLRKIFQYRGDVIRLRFGVS
jgi:nucleoside-diphosphate-sugar epimerase